MNQSDAAHPKVQGQGQNQNQFPSCSRKQMEDEHIQQ
jgi:hypothetical protein